MYTVRCKKMWNYPSFSLDFYLLLKIHWYVLFRCFWGSCFWERSSITLSVRLYAGHVLVLVFLQYINCFLKQVFSSSTTSLSDSLSLSQKLLPKLYVSSVVWEYLYRSLLHKPRHTASEFFHNYLFRVQILNIVIYSLIFFCYMLQSCWLLLLFISFLQCKTLHKNPVKNNLS